MPTIKPRIAPFLSFQGQAEEAARFYVTVFEDSRIVDVSHFSAAIPDREGTVMLVTFELAGQRFHALNGGPSQPFADSLSLLIECDGQDEIDSYWRKLTDGGTEMPCGWLKDRYGLAWQVAPTRLLELVTSRDPAVAEAAMRAMFEMKKIVLADIERAVASL